MSSPAVLDFDALLAPLADGGATGKDLRKDFSENPYRQMKRARHNARTLERPVYDDPNQAATSPREKPNWRAVVDLGKRILKESSKDLEAAAWMVEALVREHGFPGLRDGFRLCRELVERYWDDLHPGPDPDEPDGPPPRVAGLLGLNGEDSDGTLIAPIYAVALVDGAEKGPLGVSAYEQAAALEAIGDAVEKQKRIEHGAVSMDVFQNAKEAAPAGHFENVAADLREAKQAFESLFSALEAKCGQKHAPSGANIRQAFEGCERTLRALSPMSVGDAATMTLAAGTSAGEAPRTARSSGPIRSREEAFEQLRLVARFFRETEPHSVLSWQLEECVRWGRMTLPELLTDLISDSSTREALFKRVGIPTTSS